ncbi:MAG: flagellar biosynthetic protein FliR [Gammaproteobacteria bacterium]|jgi:flagellar biosynthetic protein FliR|nr:flagellar biosynthetic protein FliR [Gammaproteobacteria bacterium]
MASLAELADLVFSMMWTLLRVSGVALISPVLGSLMVPVRIRVIISVALAIAMLPLVDSIPDYPILSVSGLFAAARELGIGLAMGFVFRLAVDAALIAGQVVSMGMGLAFATVVDPNSGGVPLLGRFYVVIATLLLLAANAHLMLIEVLGRSYEFLPIGSLAFGLPGIAEIVGFGSVMFAGAIHLALPSVVAILMVNIAFGVISRAAPTLNLFAVGFPIAILMGFVVLVLGIGNHGLFWDGQTQQALDLLGVITGASGGG